MPDFVSPQNSRPLCETFKDLLKNQWTQTAVCGSRFVNVKGLTRWMERRDTNKPIANAGLLLVEVYQAEFFPLRTDDILNGRDRCILVFSILLELDYGHLIDTFRRAHVVDSNLSLPISYFKDKDLQASLERRGVPDAGRLIEKFTDIKRSYCPVEIEKGMSESLLRGDYVLPFCKRKEVNDKGSTAQVYQILVPEDLVGEKLKEAISESRIVDKEFGPVSEKKYARLF